jgi:hypothetical protein
MVTNAVVRSVWATATLAPNPSRIELINPTATASGER